MVFHERLRELRQATGMTQKQFAEAIGFRKDLYNKYERGVARPSYETLLRIADELDISLDDLFERKRGEEQRPDLQKKLQQLPPAQRKAVELLLGLTD